MAIKFETGCWSEVTTSITSFEKSITGGLELCCKELCCRIGITLQNGNYAAAKFFKKVMLQGRNYAAILKFSVEI